MLQPGDFTLVAHATEAWPHSAAVDTTQLSSTASRLLSAMSAAADDAAGSGPLDLAVLVRQLLRSEALSSGTDKPLWVPVSAPWPTAGQWRRHGVTVIATSDTRLRVQADAWLPDWLDAGSDPTAVTLTGSWDNVRRSFTPVPADPFFRKATSRATYRSTGQRDAARWLVASPPGATLIANLPTGSGKSTVGYLPALLGRARGTVVFVVPTTSLALDQARAFRDLVDRRSDATSFPRDLAYYGELAPDAKEVIRQRLSDGTQRMLFTSPEALLSGLSPALYRAAEQGAIAGLVIDEAHIVAQWGTEFRPDFQALAGVREDLLEVYARLEFELFRTMLLSATLTQDSLDALGGLFSRPGPAAVVSSVSLRHEPSYWLTHADSEDERVDRVVEALCHLPRPAIVYTTKVDDAKRLHARLVLEGWRRTAIVSGNTSAGMRREAIERLRDQSLDVVVATSAFGLGVDQPDVRAVVHACIPETIDRWYQEVGRGGRDGGPSVALLIATRADHRVARDLSERKVITLERGRERWDAMSSGAQVLPDGRLRLPLSAAPPDLDIDSRQNQAWNVRTLLLLHRAGVLALEAEAPPRRGQDEPDDQWAERVSAAFADHARHALVRPLQSVEDHDVWEGAVAASRAATIAADREAHRAIVEALEPAAPICSLLESTYTVGRDVPGVTVDLPIRVSRSCGGCPDCRAKARPTRWLVPPISRAAVGGAHRRWRSTFLARSTEEQPLAVLVGDVATERELSRALERLVERGLGVLDVGADDRLASSLLPALEREPVMLEPHWVPWTSLWLPTAIMRRSEPVDSHLLDPGGPPRVVFVSAGCRDPRHPTASIGEYHPNVSDFNHFLRQV